jgi:hypothetical protein
MTKYYICNPTIDISAYTWPMRSIEENLNLLSRRQAKEPQSTISIESVIDMLLDAQNQLESMAIPFDGDALAKMLRGSRK